MNDNKRIHVFVNGRVQGVGYRYFAQSAAQSLGLTGMVRNLADRRVEVVAEGPESDLKQYLKRLQDGPSLSHVSTLDVDWRPHRGEFSGFEIAY